MLARRPQGYAHALPLADAGFDRARVDRVTQHLLDPPRAMTELRRVLRPGGILGVAEPDWDTLVIDSGDLTISRVLTRYMADRVRNGSIGRQLSRLLAGAGFTPTNLDAHAVAYGDYDAAEQVLGIRRSLVRAVHDGYLTEHVARAWMADLETAPFTACVTIFTVTARK